MATPQEEAKASGVSISITKPLPRRPEAPLPDTPALDRRLSEFSHKSARVFRYVAYTPRQSILDRTNPESNTNPFRGFYNLFWIMIAIAILNIFYLTFEYTGEILSMTLASVFSRDAKILIASDAVLILSLFVCVPYIKLIKYLGWPSRYIAPLQYLWEFGLLLAVIAWSRYRDWPWVQSGFFVLHTLAMIMKIHSYATTNSFYADAYRHLRRTEARLDKALEDISGSAINEESWSREVQRSFEPVDRPVFLSSEMAIGISDELLTWAAHDVQQGSSLRRTQLLTSCGQDALVRTRSPLPDHARISREIHSKQTHHTPTLKGDSELRDPHPLMWHSNDEIRELALEIARTREILLPLPLDGQGIGKMWPHNVTFANFWDYLCVPTFVYQQRYPRTGSISPLYILERTLATFGTFFVLYVLIVSVIIPIVNSDRPIVAQFLHLMLPMIMCYLMIFYIIFECVCNGFAEITQFADREFYEDWWNSKSMHEFSRKWNKPVHHFLLQHVYVDSIYSLGLSKHTALFFTFFFSSLLHELVMAIATGKLRGYLFMMQMSQLPLMMLAQLPVIRQNEALANLIFWIGIIIGPPMLNIGYLVF